MIIIEDALGIYSIYTQFFLKIRMLAGSLYIGVLLYYQHMGFTQWIP